MNDDDIIHYLKDFLNVKSLGLLSKTNKKNNNIMQTDLKNYKITHDNITNLLNNKKFYTNELMIKADIEKIFNIKKINYISNNNENLECYIYNIIENNCKDINITNDTIFFTYKEQLFILNISINNNSSKYYNIIIT
jgi:hypothetical protein